MGVHAGEAVGRLDPLAGVMLDAVWFDAGPGNAGRLLLVANHLVMDTVSWRVLLADLALAYGELVAGRGAGLEPVVTSFRHWARGLVAQAGSDERLGELGVWRGLLEGAGPVLGGVPDPVRDVESSVRRVSVRVPVGVSVGLLGGVPAAFRAGVEDVLL
ncbi:condensation domain-containing protein, partial [Streptomyces sp. JW3]|uniref:condensation domain-containing protein n=1 Tax=Streptomyces sp. JW3 TaxID=3456955 RepID=UPI003FA4B171